MSEPTVCKHAANGLAILQAPPGALEGIGKGVHSTPAQQSCVLSRFCRRLWLQQQDWQTPGVGISHRCRGQTEGGSSVKGWGVIGSFGFQ